MFSSGSSNALRIQSEYVARPPTSRPDLSLTTGTSSITLPVTGPMDTSPENFSVVASLVLMSNTDESRPPNSAGIPPL